MQINRIAAPQFGLAQPDADGGACLCPVPDIDGGDAFRAEETQRLVALFSHEIATATALVAQTEAAWRLAQELVAQSDPRRDAPGYRANVDAMHARERDARNARCALEDVTAMYGPFITQMTAALDRLPGTVSNTAPPPHLA